MPTVHDLFDRQVSVSPEAVAVLCGGECISYRQFDRRAREISAHIDRHHPIGPGILVALIMDLSEHVLSSMFAVLKSGGAYVPIDTAVPDARIAFVLKDTAAPLVLTDTANAGRVENIVASANLSCVVLNVKSLLSGHITSEQSENAANASSSDLAYVIYTSGSTGIPKGVGIEHHSLVNYISNVRDHIGLHPGDVCDFSTSIGFDLTVTNTLACLCLGGTVAVYEGTLEDLPSYQTHLVARKVTFLKLTPAYFALIAASLHQTQVRKVILGGEKLSKHVLELIKPAANVSLAIFDEYGPTEATVGACFSQVYPMTGSPLDIGGFYDGCYGYIVDADGKRLGVHEVGELYIGGEGVARGYLGRPDLTADRFIEDPFKTNFDGPRGNRRLYRTGDLVEMIEGGRLKYIGRNDDQVKVRGYRIELAEIESLLKENGDVADAAVVACGNNDIKMLVGFVVPREFGCSGDELSQFLRARLPEYMIPASYVILESIPLTRNGKIDRARLAQITPSNHDIYVAPQTELQSRVSEIWAALLNTGDHRIGIHDSFVVLGGDSILAIQCLSRLHQCFGVRVTVNELFVHDTIYKLCSYLERRIVEQEASPPQLGRQVETARRAVPLLPIQRWFFESGIEFPHHFNQAFVIKTPTLDIERLSASLISLWHRHPALRFRYSVNEQAITQFYDDSAQPSGLKILDVRQFAAPEDSDRFADELNGHYTAWQSDFNLLAGPIESFGYVYGFADGSARIHVAVHHLAIDSISWRILTEDLRELYVGNTLPPQTTYYGQWCEVVARYGADHAPEEDRWKTTINEVAVAQGRLLLTLNQHEYTVRHSLKLTRPATRKLLGECQRPYNTQINDILLTAFAVAFGKTTGTQQVYITLEGHGREAIDGSTDVSRTVGWFTTLFPVCLPVEKTLLANLVSVKEQLRDLPNRGVGYGTIFGYSEEVLPRIRFNYLGQFNPVTSGLTPGWEIVNEDAGQQSLGRNKHDWLTLLGFVMQGELTFVIESRLGADLTAVLARRFHDALERLIDELSGLHRCFLTPSDIQHVVSDRVLNDLQHHADIENVFRATSLQQGFIHHALTQSTGDDTYTVQKIWAYETSIDVFRLKKAWHAAQQNFPALRLRFDWREQPVQVILRHGTLDWNYLDLTDRPPADQDFEFQRLTESDRSRFYKLGSGPLFRIYLVKHASHRFTCLFSSHHAILDGWSIAVVLNFVHEHYVGAINPRHEDAPEQAYVQVQQYLSKHYADDATFWEARIAAYTEQMNLQGLLSLPARRADIQLSRCLHIEDMRERRFMVSGDRYAGLRRLAKAWGITVNAVLLYSWQKCLQVFSGSAQTVTGVVVSGRTLPVADIENAVGLLINTLPLIVTHRDDELLRDALNKIQEDLNLLNDRCAVDLASLSGGSSRLFDTLFIYENWPDIDQNGWPADLHVKFQPDIEKLDYPLCVILNDSPTGLTIRLTYAGAFIDPAYIDQICIVWETVLAQFAGGSPPMRCGEIVLLPLNHVDAIRSSLLPAEPDFLRSDVFYNRFDTQATATPNQLAVKCAGVSLTYRELHARACRLAKLLNEFGLRREEAVVICLQRGVDLMVAILAIMKAGGAYVPVSPDVPETRIRYIFGDTDARVVITNQRYRSRLEGQNADGFRQIVAIDTLFLGDDRLVGSSCAETTTAVDASHLAYILYTSGTTGRPKGVMVEHGAFCLAIDAIRGRFFSKSSLNTFSLTNPVFDIFGLEYALPLLSGGFLEIGEEIPETLSCRDYSFIQATPSVLELLLDRLTDTLGILLMCGGEALSSELLNRVLSRGIDVAHVYGPTETTIWSMGRLYEHSTPVDTPYVDLGRPFANERVFVLNSNRHTVPVGAPGELYVAGDGLARGYLNQPDQTSQRFIDEPFGPGSPRMYRTGDLVRLLSSGELEFLGRSDFQVKIRGHRIELKEIEDAVISFSGVQQCVAVVRGNVVYAYYVTSREFDGAALSTHLRQLLPPYMLPAAVVRLEEMPLNTAGKIDRRALIPPAEQSSILTQPRTPLETSVRSVWARCLGLEDEQVGIDSDFYFLGGDSIRSIRMCADLRQHLDINIGISYLHEHPTIRQFVESLHLADCDAAVVQPLSRLSSEDCPLSFAQERLWFSHSLSLESGAYNVPLVLKVHEKVNVALMAHSICDLIKRHEVLRTVLREAYDGSIYQVANDPTDIFVLQTIEVANSEELESILRQEAHRPFNLFEEYPLRAQLYLIRDSGERRLAFVLHHIAFDGWSIDILLRDLLALYTFHERRGCGISATPELPLLPVSYHEFALWERRFLTEDHLASDHQFWQSYLAGFESLRLPNDYKRPEVPDYHGAHHRFQVDAETSSHLHELAAMLRTSLFNVLLSACYITLRAFCYQDDIVLGVSFANRSHGHSENLLGVFVNSLPLRKRIDVAALVSDFIRDVSTDTAAALRHQQLPFEKLVESLNLGQDRSRHPIFQFFFDVQNFGKDFRDAQMPLSLAAKAWEFGNFAKHDLGVFVDDSQEGLDVFVNYATALFRKETVAAFAATYAELLTQFAVLARDEQARLGLRLCELRLLSEGRYQEVVTAANGAGDLQESSATLCKAFEQQAAKLPRSVAVVYGQTRLTYSDLNSRSNRLAHYLVQSCGVRPGVAVPLCLCRSEHMLVAILAVLKAGAAYVPLEPTEPDSRLLFIINDCRACLVLTDKHCTVRLQEVLQPTAATAQELVTVLAVDDLDLSKESTENPSPLISCESLAYVIYTSGSSGKPKGVLEVHKNVVRLFEATNRICPITSDDIWPLFHSYAFDFSVWEIWGALLHGGCLVIPSLDEIRDTERFYELCEANGVTVLNQTPAAFSAFLDVALAPERNRLAALRYLFIGGEQWDVEILVRWFRKFGGTRPLVVHVYGPTETTVFASMRPFTWNGDIPDSSIGPVLPNMVGYVVDPEMRLLPVGAIGELCLGGTGLATGYLHRDHLTAAAFLRNPFQTGFQRADRNESPDGRNARIYRTGDLVRCSTEGHLTFIGRNDSQVKLHGRRIELGEIESALMQFHGIRRCCAVIRSESQDAGPYLAAYYVSSSAVDEASLRAHLASVLPSYMLPSALVAIERIPLTLSGKIDRGALPAPAASRPTAFIAPKTATEFRVRQIMSEILGVDETSISVDHDFFGLGGSSIKSIRLLSRLNREFDTNISIAALLRSPSVAVLAKNLESTTRTTDRIPKNRPEDPEHQVLSYAQERLWFVDQYERGTSAYNIGLTYELAPHVDLDALSASLRAIYERHEPLRTIIRHGSSCGYQLILDSSDHPLEINHQSIANEHDLRTALARDVGTLFDLANDAPFRVTIYEMNSRQYLSFVIHHIAFDGWSVEILLSELEEFYRLYAACHAGESIVIPELPFQYRDFAAWERAQLSRETIERLATYWKERLKDHEPLNLPTDHRRPPTTCYLGDGLNFEMTEQATIALKELATELKVTLFSVLLAAYYLLLRTYSHQDDLIVGIPIANRAHSELDRLIGCLLNTLPLDFHVNGGERITDLIRRVSARVAEGHEHQQLPFESLVAELSLPVDPSRHPVFQVTFDVNSFSKAYFTDMEAASGAVLRYYRHSYGSTHSAKFDLSASIDDTGDCLQGTFTYATSLFERASIEGITATYSLILQQFAGLAGQASTAGLTVSHLQFLSASEREVVLQRWGEGPRVPRTGRTVLDLFEEQARSIPNEIAVVFGDRSITYAQLYQQAAKLALWLRKAGIGRDDLVLLCLARSEWIIVAILGTWKAGAAYVPVDPESPDGRLAYILNDTRAKAVLCDRHLLERWRQVSAALQPLIATPDHLPAYESKHHLDGMELPRPSADDLAYVIYTSGTLGEPKGVMIEHGSLANLHADQTVRYRIGEGGMRETILQVSNYIFDASVEQFVLALPNGHVLLMVPNNLWLDLQEFQSYLRHNCVTHISATPTFFNQFDIGRLPHLKRYIVGGEPLESACYERILASNRADVFNQYGPTEITVTAVGECICDGDISIGRPMANVQVYVVSLDGEPVPPGAVGELFIAGMGVARGYLNKPTITSQSFLPNPFQTEEEKSDREFGPQGRHARMYRTGDLVRWRRDGRIDYIGRADQQVKIRGFRIELNEITSVLSSYPGVTRSVVVVRERPIEQLVAYYTSDAPLDENRILQHLKNSLPDYMVPPFLVRVATIPMTTHGKLDLSALPTPRLARPSRSVKPVTEMQTRLRSVWSEILELPESDIGIQDDFFEIGGNSILAIRLVGRLNAITGADFTIAEAFVHRTIRSQSSVLVRAGQGISILNSSADRPCLFMVHPAHAGSEAYASLAARLEGHFHCIGIDSHNLHAPQKIDSLRELAVFYLSKVDAFLAQRQQQQFRFLGWSLGGQIALEIASELEDRGIGDIHVCAIDTILPDKRVLALSGSIEEQKAAYLGRLRRTGFDSRYIAAVLGNFETDYKLSVQTISRPLARTKVLLVRALSVENQASARERELHQYVISSSRNNFNQIHLDTSRIQTVNLLNAHHFNILQHEDEILTALSRASATADAFA